ncbi:MAG TPA: MATE family efflux transporter [Acidimicrobiia bacterium]
MAIPALAALAADPLLSLVDAGFVARLGTPALAALGINGAVFGFAFVMFNFLAYATTPMVAQAMGRGEPDQARLTIARAIWLALLLGGIAAALLNFLARPIVLVLQAGPEVVEPAVAYLRIRALAAPAVLVVTAAHGAFRGLHDTRTPLMVAVVTNLVHAGLDPLLIYGFDWGVEGAAAASLLAQTGAAIWFWRLISGRIGAIRLGKVSRIDLSPFLRSGGLLTLRTVMLVLTATLGTAAAAAIGTSRVAAHQVVRETWFLSAMLIDGVAIAAQALVAEQVGKRDEAMAHTVSRRLVVWGGWTGLAVTLAWLLGGPSLGSLFASSPEVETLIVSATKVAAVFAVPSAILWVLDGIFLARLQLRTMALSTGAGLVAGAVVFWITLRWGWDLAGIWWGMGAMVMARLAVLTLRPDRDR